MSVVTMNHIHNKSSTSNTEMLDLVQTRRICIVLSVSMQLSFDLFKLITLLQANP